MKKTFAGIVLTFALFASGACGDASQPREPVVQTPIAASAQYKYQGTIGKLEAYQQAWDAGSSRNNIDLEGAGTAATTIRLMHSGTVGGTIAVAWTCSGKVTVAVQTQGTRLANSVELTVAGRIYMARGTATGRTKLYTFRSERLVQGIKAASRATLSLGGGPEIPFSLSGSSAAIAKARRMCN